MLGSTVVPSADFDKVADAQSINEGHVTVSSEAGSPVGKIEQNILNKASLSRYKPTLGDIAEDFAKARSPVVGTEQNAPPDTPENRSKATRGGTGVFSAKDGSTALGTDETAPLDSTSDKDSKATHELNTTSNYSNDTNEDSPHTTAAILPKATQKPLIEGTNLFAWHC